MHFNSKLRNSNLRARLGWAAAGVAVVASLQLLVVYGHGTGNWAWLLGVAPEKPFHERIEAELGTIENKYPGGHDGEMFYLIARDPLGRHGVPELLSEVDNAAYRYQRIFYPLLAGGFGKFGPRMTLALMIVLVWVGAAIGMYSMAELYQHWSLDRWTMLLALANPGLIMASGLLTSDVLAWGLAMAGFAAVVQRRSGLAMLALALAVLTRETMLLIPLGVAGYGLSQRRFRQPLVLVLASATPLLTWVVYLQHHYPSTSSGFRNLTWPMLGIVDSISAWMRSDLVTGGDIFLGVVGIVLLSLGAVLILTSKNRLLNWCSSLWVLAGISLSIYVWGRPNNALRILAPLWSLSTLNLAALLRSRTTTDDSDRAQRAEVVGQSTQKP